ncbi:hypothetical protein [Dactylosporangium sp. NPDC049140]|uniref:hypothetical protein n=1 Tax=Dactylosporangium sp. NPDC049140 TaxID=3155647 RepID=UPI0033CFE856
MPAVQPGCVLGHEAVGAVRRPGPIVPIGQDPRPGRPGHHHGGEPGGSSWWRRQS